MHLIDCIDAGDLCHDASEMWVAVSLMISEGVILAADFEVSLLRSII